MLEVVFVKKPAKQPAAKVIALFEELPIETTLLTSEEAALVKKAVAQSGFKGAKKQFVTVYGGKSKILLVGLGRAPSSLDIQETGSALFRELFEDERAVLETPDTESAEALVYGLLLGSYCFDKYKTEKKPEDFPKLESMAVLSQAPKVSTEAFKPYLAMVTAVRYCKDLCNEPASYLTPEVMADDVKRLEYLGLDVDVLTLRDIKIKGLGLVEAVARGAVNEPRVVVMSWKGNREQEAYDLGLVGKGVCFDAGGLSLKSNAGMESMKMDMAGAAAVAAFMKSAALQRVRKNLIAVLCLVDNMPDGQAVKIGDVCISYSGKTVEIMNADAEGRLIVADGLSYLQKNYPVKKIVDVTTFGSVKGALGKAYAGVFTNDDRLAAALEKAGVSSGDALWRMPLNPAYVKALESKIADICNVASLGEAAIVSAAFLSRFVEKGVKWAHIDMSGVKTGKDGLASGFGVRLLNDFVKGL